MRKRVSTAQERKLDELTKRMAKMEPERVEAALRAAEKKSVQMAVRLTPSDKDDIDRAAELLGVSVGEYLVLAHRLCFQHIKHD